MTPLTSLVTRLDGEAASLKLTIDHPSPALLRASKETTLGKWMLGGRKARYTASCALDEGAHIAAFREKLAESSWGIAPPSIKVETTRQHGTAASAETSAKGFGGGSAEMGAFRTACERAVKDAGWTFVFESGKSPN